MRILIIGLTGTLLCSASAWAADTTPHQLTLHLPASAHWKTDTVLKTDKAQLGQASKTTETFSYDNRATSQADGYLVTRTLLRQDLQTSGMDMSTIMLGDRQKAYSHDLSEVIGNIAYTTNANLTPVTIMDWDTVKAKMRALSMTYMGDIGSRTFDATIGESSPESAAASYLSTQTAMDALYAAPLSLNTPVTSETYLPAVLMNAGLKATQTLTLTRWDTLADRAEYRIDIKPDPQTLKATMREFASHMFVNFDPASGHTQIETERQKTVDTFVEASQFSTRTICRITASIRTGLMTQSQCDTQVDINLPPVDAAQRPGMKIRNATKLMVTQSVLPQP